MENYTLDRFHDCPQALKDFLFYLQTIRGRSIKTVEAYHVDLRLFLRYIKKYKSKNNLWESYPIDEIPIDDIPNDLLACITLSDVYSYLNYTQTGRNNNASTRARKVSALRSFYKYLTTKAHIIEENPLKELEIPSTKQTIPRYLTLNESRELLIHVPEGKNYERDYCIITFFLNCGMRLSELCGINIQDIKENTLRLLGKGNKERIIYLNDSCMKALEDYLKNRKASKAEPNALFLSSQLKRITPRRVEQIVASSLQLSNLNGKGYSPHKLRHTAATLMYQHGGVDIRALKEILGHANLSTTEIYTHISDEQLEKAASRSPLADEYENSRKKDNELTKEEVDKKGTVK